jgi:dTDP-4-dehydrorhamnose 3,5-epimerase
MKVSSLKFPGVFIIEPRIFEDKRGHFLETFQVQRYSEFGIPPKFVQDNVSYSRQGVLRGLHYQLRRPQGKLICTVQGAIFDVVLDIRKSSPNFGKWTSMVLDSQEYRQLYVPEGFAHGFYVLSERATVIYKCTDYYEPQDERGVFWDDPDLGINWPGKTPVLSEKDRAYLGLKHILLDQLPE